MSDDNEELTEAEQDEAMRRVMQGMGGDTGLLTEEGFRATLQILVEMGLAERSEDGTEFRLTEEGDKAAVEVMQSVLNSPPPRQDADAHLWSMLVENSDDQEAIAMSFEYGKQVIAHEHYRLADVIAGLDEPWAEEFSEAIRQGLL